MNTKIISGLLLSFALLTNACAPMTESPVPSGGKVFNGEYAGIPFTIATDNSAALVENFLEAYNQMDVEKMITMMADTVLIYDHAGDRTEMTGTMLKDYMADMDSVRQDIYAIIPVMLEDGDRVSVLVDSQEWRWGSDGTEWRMRLWERYIVQDDRIIGLRQWSRAIQGM